MHTHLRGIAGVAILAVSLVCSLLGGAARAQPSAAGMATINITSPVGTITNPQVADKNGIFTIAVVIQNFTFDVAHIGTKPNRAGFGHYHVYADSFDPSSPFKFYVQNGATNTILIRPDTLAKAGVSAGVHTIYVVLANNDHSLIAPLAVASTVIRVVPPVPPASLSITSPIGTVSNPQVAGSDGSFTFVVAPKNFSFDAAHLGFRPNKPGSGHYHVYADSIDPNTPFKYWIQAGATTTVQVKPDAMAKAGVTTGTHTLFVVLTNNDHSVLRPVVVASTVIRIGPAIQVAEWGNQAQPLALSSSGRLILHVRASSFLLDAGAIGSRSNKPGHGHYQVYVGSFDPNNPAVNMVAEGAGPTVEVTGAALSRAGARPGVHALYVVLANNDRTLAAPITGANGFITFG